MQPKMLEKTSASIGNTAWELMRRQDLRQGMLFAFEIDGKRGLGFMSGPGEPFLLGESAIVSVTKVASGLNTIVDVVYGESISNLAYLCLVGPRGRMRTIFATVGHPL